MHTSVELQIWQWAVLFLLGIFCNIIFHVYTALRAVITPTKLAGHILDALIAVVVLIIVAYVVFIVNYGELRLYILISLSLGFLLCNTLVGKLIYGIALLCFTAVKNIFDGIKQVVVTGCRKINQKIFVPLAKWLSPPTPPANGNNSNNQ